ncbi:TonB-dependent receptor [Mariniflexile litorale]|uniref:TonB-dependent receptor n=1 Tax=Mariniflexile litorale TaxID=3045158 RepID=A0AAU7EGW5_9FLAO|nr:TonB-dependent receptor [Mariniflexile sp. KMM 9835]MDQ8210863.1 TonB-dependent receptor [Mariniflexile sp. KMM 9835]
MKKLLHPFFAFNSKRLFLLVFLGLGITTAFAQQKTITGSVTDINGLPIAGATIILKGTTTGASTDFDGTFSININTSSVLVFSYVGYKTQEVDANGKNTIDVALEENIALLDEVVVIGYGTSKKSDVTGAVASADLETFRDSPNTNIAQSLQGTVPGLNIGQVNSAGATPEISIRGRTSINGNSDVLIILDGIQYNGSLSSLNPADIKSIDVLKDASSTAVYGAQAANGVILITTQSGKRDQKPKITISSSYATQAPSEDLRPMQREEYIDYLNMQLYDRAFLAPEYTTPNPAFTGYFEQRDLNPNDMLGIPVNSGNPELFKDTDYNWWDEGTQTGYVMDNKISVTGGSEKMSYLVSLGLTEQEGYIKRDDFQRKSIRVNLDADATDWWNIGVQAFGSFVNQDGDQPNLYSLVIAPPVLTPYDENGDLVRNPTGTLDSNPFLGSNTEDLERKDYLFANIYSEIDFPFIPGLSYRLNFGNNYRIEKRYGASIYAAGGNGEAGKDIRFYNDYTLDNILKYNRVFGKHDVGATLLYGAMERKWDNTNAYATSFDRLSLGYNKLSLGGLPEISSGAYSDQLNYQMFRFNYKYNNKYIVTGTIRKDGYSAFADNEKTAYFPSGALGWIVSSESFMDNADFVNNLKLRASYGLSGNQTPRYTSLARLDTRASYVFGEGGTTAFGQELASLANGDLRWEKTAGLNVGVDFILFSNKLNGTIDVYQSTTDDLLYKVRIPYLTGFDEIQTNVGKLENKGIEISLTGNIVRTQDFKWTATANYSKNKNKILELTGEDADGDGKEDDLIQSNLFIGESIGAIYDYETNGIYQIGEENIPAGYQAGQYRIVDQNDDGLITQADDRKIIGTKDPGYRVSLLNTFTYKQFSLSVFFNSIQGGNNTYISRNDNALYRDSNSIFRNNLSGIDYWSPENPDGLNALSPNRPGITGTRYEDRSFVRLQDITLKYSFDNAILDKLSISDLSVFVSGKNLATWTKWNGWDPEYQNVSDNVYGVGMSAGGRPVMSGYSFGINVSF